ncbi:MAG: glycosyltransferase family 2 protein [Bacteroidota bacterium]|jgi:glycosyltransferase, group 2 family
MFSVIIPLYNKAPYVAKAIESVLGQTYRDFEVIVIDDGSTDQSLEVAKTFENKSITIVSQPNSGVSTARNNGVKIAKYPYICFLDADDWWHPTFLEEMKRLITDFPDAGIYGSGYYIVKNGQERIAPIGVPQGFERGIIDYCEVYAKTLCMPLTSISVVIPKHIFDEEKGFKSQLKFGEDFDLWIRIALKHKVILVNKPLAYYNQDVDINNRGVAVHKIYSPENHYIFNLDYLYDNEKNNHRLKILLDKLRVYILLKYRMQRAFPKEYNAEIKKVDFSVQPLGVRLQYYLPVWFLKQYYGLKFIVWNIVKGK